MELLPSVRYLTQLATLYCRVAQYGARSSRKASIRSIWRASIFQVRAMSCRRAFTLSSFADRAMCRHLSACLLQSRAALMARTCRRRAVLATPPLQGGSSTSRSHGRNCTCHRGSEQWRLAARQGQAIRTLSVQQTAVLSHQRPELRSREEARRRS